MEVSFHQSSLGKSKSIPFLSCSTVNFKGKRCQSCHNQNLKKKLNLYKQEFKLLFVSVTALPFSRGELSTGPGKAACSPTLLVSHWSYPTYFFHCLNHLESTRYLNTKILCMSILFTSKILYIIILYKSYFISSYCISHKYFISSYCIL